MTYNVGETSINFYNIEHHHFTLLSSLLYLSEIILLIFLCKALNQGWREKFHKELKLKDVCNRIKDSPDVFF